MPDLLHAENPIDQLGDGQRKDGVDMVPKPPLFEHPIGPPPAAGQPLAKAIEKRVEIVVGHHENLPIGVLGVEVGQMAGQLEADGRLARALFAEHDRRGRLGRVAVDLVPGGMERAADAGALETRSVWASSSAKGFEAMP